MTRWWAGIPGAATTVICGGEEHTLRWQAGRLVAVDHPDAAGERTLAVLAGQPRPCLELLGAWERHADDLDALVIGSRSAYDLLANDEDRPRRPPARRQQASGGMVRMSTQRSGPAASQELTDPKLRELLSLDGGVAERLQSTVAAAWVPRLAAAEPAAVAARPLLQAALYGRLLAVLRDFLRAPQLQLELTLAEPGQTTELKRDGELVRARFGLQWLTEVWAREFALGFGRLCLAARSEDGVHWALDTVGPALGPVTTITLELA